MAPASSIASAASHCAWACWAVCSLSASAFHSHQDMGFRVHDQLTALHDAPHPLHDALVAIGNASVLRKPQGVQPLVVPATGRRPLFALRPGFHKIAWTPTRSSQQGSLGTETELDEPFVIVTSSETEVTVEIASASVILSIYLLIFVPLCMGWGMAYHYGSEGKFYLVLMPLTYVAMTVGLDLVNQSLTALMDSPMSITAIQALALFLITGLWSAFRQWRQPFFSFQTLAALKRWTIVACLFGLYQLVNHEVSRFCSLSERTVFYNLLPLAMLIAEVSFLPSNIKTHMTFNSKMALAGMVLGTAIFALQYPDFTTLGLVAAIGMIVSQVPYRLFQRWTLVECLEVPIIVLACYDGLILFMPSAALARYTQDSFWEMWNLWFADTSIALMLVLSWITFTGAHVTGLLMLRATSATGTIVFHSSANVIMVILGIVLFGDDVLSTFTMIGILITLACGTWYAVDLVTNSASGHDNCSKEKTKAAEELVVSSLAATGVPKTPETRDSL